MRDIDDVALLQMRSALRMHHSALRKRDPGDDTIRQ